MFSQSFIHSKDTPGVRDRSLIGEGRDVARGVPVTDSQDPGLGRVQERRLRFLLHRQ